MFINYLVGCTREIIITDSLIMTGSIDIECAFVFGVLLIYIIDRLLHKYAKLLISYVQIELESMASVAIDQCVSC